MPFDPSQPFETLDSGGTAVAEPQKRKGFDPSQPYEVVTPNDSPPTDRDAEGNRIEPQGEPGYAHKLITNLWYGGEESNRQQPQESDEEYQRRLAAQPKGTQGERPPLTEPIAGGIDAAASWLRQQATGQSDTGQDTALQDLVKTGTYEPSPNEPSFFNAAIPRPVGQQEGVLPQIGAAAANIPVDLANFALSPGATGTAFDAILSKSPALIQRAVAAGFSLQQAWDAYNAGTLQDKLEAIAGAVLGGYGALRHGEAKHDTARPIREQPDRTPLQDANSGDSRLISASDNSYSNVVPSTGGQSLEGSKAPPPQPETTAPPQPAQAPIFADSPEDFLNPPDDQPLPTAVRIPLGEPIPEELKGLPSVEAGKHRVVFDPEAHSADDFTPQEAQPNRSYTETQTVGDVEATPSPESEAQPRDTSTPSLADNPEQTAESDTSPAAPSRPEAVVASHPNATRATELAQFNRSVDASTGRPYSLSDAAQKSFTPSTDPADTAAVAQLAQAIRRDPARAGLQGDAQPVLHPVKRVGGASAPETRQIVAAEALAKANNARVVWFDSPERYNGARLGNNILINIRATDDPVLHTTAHELAHRLETERPDLARDVINHFQTSEGFDKYRQNRLSQGYGEHQLLSELFADATGDTALNKGHLQRLMGENPSLGTRLVSWIKEAIRQMAHRLGFNRDKIPGARDALSNLREIQARIVDAFGEARKGPRRTGETGMQRAARAEFPEFARKQSEEDEYRGQHTAPMHDSGSPLYDMARTYPEDVYSHNAARYYGHWGDHRDNESIHIIQAMRDRPGARIRIYRTVPKEVSAGINKGDWVTISRAYAKEHGESQFDNYKILSKVVSARDIFTNGDSIHEWGYDPQPFSSEIEQRAKLRRLERREQERRLPEELKPVLDRLRAKYPEPPTNQEPQFQRKQGESIPDYLKREGRSTREERKAIEAQPKSRIANKFTEQRMASGELGELAPSKGVVTRDVLNRGLQMPPEEIARHVSDVMQEKGGKPELQAAAIRAEEARLSKRSADLSRIAEATPADRQARLNADNAFHDLTDFHKGPVAKLKSMFHTYGMSLQGDLPVDLGTFEGLRQAWLKDAGEAPPRSAEPVLRKTAQRVSEVTSRSEHSINRLGEEIDRTSRRVPSAEDVRNRILAELGKRGLC